MIAMNGLVFRVLLLRESIELGNVLYFFAERYITICDFINEFRIWVEDHNVEMLNCLN